MKRILNIGFTSVMIFSLLHCAGLTAQTDTLCFNDTLLYRIPAPDNQVYDWVISGGSIIYSSTRKDSVVVVWNESTGPHFVEAIKINENNCTSEPERREVFVYMPGVDLGVDRAICEGSNELLVAEPGYEEYYWNDQPGTNEFIISTEGLIKLEVKDKYGCWAGDSLVVIEKSQPEPEFIMDIDPLNQSVTLFNVSDSAWQYYWDFGDGSYSDAYNPGIHSYPGPGTYEITLRASANGCSGTISKQVTIIESLVADFKAIFEGCAPVEIIFENLSTGADTYYWDFGNGNSSTDETPVTLYSEPGIYEVSLYAKKDTVIRISKKSVFVNEAPVADFEIIPSETNTFKEIDFINETSGAVKYRWDFGDGETSELYEPIHSYSSQGVYDVSLSVWSGAGCFDSLLLYQAVRVSEDCRMLFPSGFIPNKNGPTGGYYDPAQKPDNNEVFHPIYEKIDAYELKIFNRWGELVFLSRSIDVGWDGYYKGSLAPQDTYIYQVKATCFTGEEIAAKGSVSLIY